MIAATQVPPANEWIAKAFEGKKITQDMVKTALSQAKQHFKVTNGFYELIGWPLSRRVECGVNAEFDPDPRLGRDLVDDVVAWRQEKPTGGRGRGKHHRGDNDDEHEDRVSKMGGNKKRQKMLAAESQKPQPKTKAKTKAPAKEKAKALPVPKAHSPSPEPESEEEEPIDVDPGNISSKIKFLGKPRKGGVYRNRTYYDSFQTTINKEGKVVKQVYHVGMTVYAMPGDPSEDMYLAQIDSVFEDDTGQYVDCVWLERAKDVKNMVDGGTWKDMKCYPNEVFLCTTVNANPIQSIEGPAKIIAPDEWKRLQKKIEDGGDPVFVCRRALVVKASSKKRGAKKGSNMSFPEARHEEGKGFQVVGLGPKKPAKGK